MAAEWLSICHTLLDRSRSSARSGWALTLRLPSQAATMSATMASSSRHCSLLGHQYDLGPGGHPCAWHRGPEVHNSGSSTPLPAPASCLCGPSEPLVLPAGLATKCWPRTACPDLHLLISCRGESTEGRSAWPLPWLLHIFLKPVQALRRAPLHGWP